jgi:hypothetical protein
VSAPGVSSRPGNPPVVVSLSSGRKTPPAAELPGGAPAGRRYGQATTPVGGAGGGLPTQKTKVAGSGRLNGPSPGPPAPAPMSARDATAAHDLITGNFVGAYGLSNPAPHALSDPGAVPSSTLASVIQFVAARRMHHAGMPHPESQDLGALTPSSLVDRMPHGSRGPQGSVQSSAGGGGAASPLILMMAFALIVAPCLKFVPRPIAPLVCAEPRRLERPG